MALRDQPYLPLYVQDFLTDEKLSMCSAASTGVYIRLMCLMHKSDPYGMILIKQKHKQSDNQIKNFASLIARNLPYDLLTVESALQELIDESVLRIEGDYLIQKRMVSDNELSVKRSKAGKNGGSKTQEKVKFALANDKASDLSNDKAKSEANSEYESEIENENVGKGKEGMGEKPSGEIPPAPEPSLTVPLTTDIIIHPSGKKSRSKSQSTGTVAQNPPELLVVQCYWAEWTVYAEKPRPGCTKEMAFHEAEVFYNYQVSKGWKIGKEPMKSWQGACRTWILRKESEGLHKLSNQNFNNGKATVNSRDAREQGVADLDRQADEILRASGII